MLKSPAIGFLVFILLASFAARLHGQEAPVDHFKMEKIAFKGTRAFTDEQLLSALGMKIGTEYTQQNLVDAANRLANSGVFSQVSYRFASTSAEFFLTDNPSLLPIRFENCVWIADDQMVSKLKQRVPFFLGKVPAQGALTEEVGKQVETVLADNGVKARVQYMPFVENGSVKAITYTVIDPRVEISAIHFVGATPEIANALDESAKSVLGMEYIPQAMQTLRNEKLRAVLRERGYLQGRFGDSSLKLVSAAGAPVAKVELTLPVAEGAQYRIASLTVKGSDPIALDAAKRLSMFKTGLVANMTAFRAELSRLGSAYLAAGYMNAEVKADPTFDESAHTVSYDIELLPGQIYKLSKLDVQGLDDTQKAKLQGIWKLNPGDAYDPTYAPNFMHRNISKLGFLKGYSLAWTQKIYDDSNTVELFIFFRRR